MTTKREKNRMYLIRKRNGKLDEFTPCKIIDAILKAAMEVGVTVSDEKIKAIINPITELIQTSDLVYNVEEIQDLVEEGLMTQGYPKIAKAYILYRAEKNRLRIHGWDMTDLQRDILEKKYFYKGEKFTDFVERVGKDNPKIQKLIRAKKFLPAGRILMGRGLNEKGTKVTYSNCFVITPPEDNLESIFDTAKKMARTYSYGGGCGTSLEKLRPRGAAVHNSAKSTSGAVSFMDLYSMTTGLIGQNSRRK